MCSSKTWNSVVSNETCYLNSLHKEKLLSPVDRHRKSVQEVQIYFLLHIFFYYTVNNTSTLSIRLQYFVASHCTPNCCVLQSEGSAADSSSVNTALKREKDFHQSKYTWWKTLRLILNTIFSKLLQALWLNLKWHIVYFN